MRTLITLIVLLAIVAAVVGWYQGWFQIEKKGDSHEFNVNVTVDKDKAKEKINELGDKFKPSASTPADKEASKR